MIQTRKILMIFVVMWLLNSWSFGQEKIAPVDSRTAAASRPSVEPAKKIEPRTRYTNFGVYRTNPSPISPSLAKKLSRFVSIIDYDAQGIEAIKKENPHALVIAYCNPMELFDPRYSEGKNQVIGFGALYGSRPLQGQLYKFVYKQRKEWFLNQPDGMAINYWLQPPMRLMNLSELCPVVEGQQWSDYLACYLLDNVFNNPAWDGLFIDNCWENISWIAEKLEIQMDLNNNGQADETLDQIDISWRNGVEKFIRLIREAKGPDFIIIGNKPCLEHAQLLNGKMWEDFPPPCHEKDWDKTMAHYLALSSRPGFDYSLIQTKGGEREVRLGLTSALLGNGYYVYSQDSTKQFEIFEADLGRPLGPAISPHLTIFKEDFSTAEITSFLVTGDTAKITSASDSRNLDSKCLALLPGQKIKTQLLAPGEYIISYQHQLEDRQRAILLIQVLDKQDRQISQERLERWQGFWQFHHLELKEPSSICWQVVDVASVSSSLPSRVFLDRIEVTKVLPGVWLRPFEKGWVFCNPSGERQPIFPFLPGLALPPKDGLIWLKNGTVYGKIITFQQTLPQTKPDEVGEFKKEEKRPESKPEQTPPSTGGNVPSEEKKDLTDLERLERLEKQAQAVREQLEKLLKKKEEENK